LGARAGSSEQLPRVRFAAEELTELIPRSNDGTPMASPLTSLAEEDWTVLRGEVGRLKHAALVEIVMQCLGEAYDVHAMLSGDEG
jgi:hypothetical protein